MLRSEYILLYKGKRSYEYIFRPYDIITSSGLACNDCQESLFKRIQRGQFDFPAPEWENVSEEAKDLICHLLVDLFLIKLCHLCLIIQFFVSMFSIVLFRLRTYVSVSLQMKY